MRVMTFAGVALGAQIVCLQLAATSVGAQSFTSFPLTSHHAPSRITAGPDGNLWFTDPGQNSGDPKVIGQVTPAGSITFFTIQSGLSPAGVLPGIATGADGNLWFAGNNATIGRMTPSGIVTAFPIPSGANANAITPGPDGNLWFTEPGHSVIGRITPAGTVTEFPAPGLLPGTKITAGPDGNLWFGSHPAVDPAVGRITPSGVTTKFSVTSNSPDAIAAGADGNLWFVGMPAKVGRITPSGTVTLFPMPSGTAGTDITAGPDGNLWVVDQDNNAIFQVTTAGVVTQFTFPSQGGANQFATGITTGPDGNLWVAALGAPAIWRVTPPTPANQLFAAVLPVSRSVQVGKFATAFASIFNNTSASATGCGIVPVTSVPASFLFQTTSPTTNALTGTPNTPATIPPGQGQSFLMAFQASAPFSSTNVVLGFDCAGLAPVATIIGVNTLLLTFDANPVPDMIAVGLTPTNDGFSHTGGPSGTGIFAIAASNIGTSASLTAKVTLLDPSMPLTVTVCQTDSQTGQCLQTPAPNVTGTIGQNQNTTWSAFLQASGTIPADPAHFRVFFQFVDANGVIRGSTSTAVTTQ